MAYLLFDIGASKMRIGCSRDDENLSEYKIVETPFDFEQGVRLIQQCAEELLGNERPTAIAGGITRSNLPGWAGASLSSRLRDIYGIAAHVENDTAMVGLGEAIVGSGRASEIVAYVTVSTGVGGVRITGGRIDPYAVGFEPGHQIVVADGVPCPGCAGRGHLEGYISGKALEARHGVKPRDITDAAVWDEAARFLAYGLNNIVVHWSPLVIVLGGSMMKKPGIPLEKVEQYLRETCTIFPVLPELRLAMLGEIGGLHGALVYLKNLDIEGPSGHSMS